MVVRGWSVWVHRMCWFDVIFLGVHVLVCVFELTFMM